MDKKYFVALLFILLWVSSKASDGKWTMAIGLGDTTAHTAIYAMNYLNNSEIAFAGSFGSRNLKMGSETLTGKGANDAFVGIAGLDGTLKWGLGFGGNSDERATAVATDGNGNIYVAGTFNSLSFKVGGFTLMNKGEADGFLIKINNQRQVEWALGFGGLGIDEINSLATDQLGNVYLVGQTTSYQHQTFELFVTKVAPDKSIVWHHKVPTAGTQVKANTLVTNSNNNIYIGGSFAGVLTFDKQNQLTSSKRGEAPYEYHETNAFVAQYNTNGNLLNAKAFESFTQVNALASNGTDIFACGDNINYGMGWGWPLSDSKIYTLRLNNKLEKMWERTAGGLTPMQSLDLPTAIAVNSTGEVLLTGLFFSQQIEFAGLVLKNIQNKEYFHRQAFVLKYDANGNEIWGTAIGGNLCDIGNAILPTPNGGFVVAGTYESSPIRLDGFSLINNSTIHEMYVHLRPPRQVRNAFAFLAMHDSSGSGNNAIGGETKYKLYPNPASDFFLVDLATLNKNGGELGIYTINGRCIEYQTIEPGESQILVRTNHLREGVCFVKLKVDEHVSVQKLLKK